MAGSPDTELALEDGAVAKVGQLSNTVETVAVVTVVVNHIVSVSVSVVVIGSGISGS